ncbi:hypothetical protein FDZ84_30410 [Saccharopolyspora sp. ASAGF58]|nr:hypothetical protein FDZ84_30410 [Saccharopolyspora sp. ASAGF58]
MEPIAEQTHDLEIFEAIRGAVASHGGAPYPVEDMATLAGVDDAEGVRRVLDQMVAEGLAIPPAGT